MHAQPMRCLIHGFQVELVIVQPKTPVLQYSILGKMYEVLIGSAGGVKARMRLGVDRVDFKDANVRWQHLVESQDELVGQILVKIEMRVVRLRVNSCIRSTTACD